MSEILNETSITNENETASTETITTVEATIENIPSMKDFEDEINRSFHKIEEDSLLKGTVIGITDTSVILDLGSYSEGIIPIDELSHDPRFSIKTDVVIGEELSGVVLREDREGNIILSKKQADTLLSYDILKGYMENKTIKRVKISDIVNGGVITYLEGIRAFIPASQLTLSYTEDLTGFLHKELDVMVITVDEEKEKLVLSGKEVERKIAAEDKSKRVSRLQIGLVTTGIVDKIVPYGAFIDMGEGLSGLVHISQICGKRIKSPNEVLKEGMEVNVKITDIKDGKISLSIKAVTEEDDVAKEGDDVPFEYSSDGDVSTGLGSLLSKIKL